MTTAISIAESLIEFRKVERPKPKDKGGKGKSGGDPHRGSEKTKGSKEHQARPRPPFSYFFCDGPHKARECPKKSKLSALIEEREQEEAKIGALQLLSAIEAKVEVPKNEKKGGCSQRPRS